VHDTSINNGNEPQGKSLRDGLNDLFRGSSVRVIVILRKRAEEAITTTQGIFHTNRHTRGDSDVQKAIPLTELSGFQLARPCGKLPPKFIWHALLFPQLQVKLTAESKQSGHRLQYAVTIVVEQEGETLDM
jgi:hypothetical protein